MILTNTTPMVARVDVAPTRAGDRRAGLLVAKATFRWNDLGEIALDTQFPDPLSFVDRDTELGIVPRDDLPLGDDLFELVVLASAHARDGQPASSMEVAFELGTWRRTLRIFGDRHWQGADAAATISPPEPFAAMPLTWSRAFGGTCSLEIDEDTHLAVLDPRNPAGRGFDPAPQAAALQKTLLCPAGYPRGIGTRPLPNIESADSLISHWDDQPTPAGWGALPIGSTWPRPKDAPASRAAPACRFPTPPAEQRIAFEGLSLGPPIGLSVPTLRVVADASSASRHASHDLSLVRWVARVDERMLTALYQLQFTFRSPRDELRELRLRLIP
jgi:hypothetical protein